MRVKQKKRKNQSSYVGLERSSSIVIKDKPIGSKKKKGGRRKGIDHNYHEKKEIEKRRRLAKLLYDYDTFSNRHE